MNSEIQFERTGRAALALGGMLFLALILPAGCARPMPGAVDVSDDSVALLAKEFESSGGGATVVEVAAPEPDGFATLRGRFVLKGAPPGTLAVITPGKRDQSCSANFPNEQLVIGDGGGIQNMMIYVDTRKFKIPVGDKKWEHQEYRDTMNAVLEGSKAFDQKDCRFLSHVFTMRATQTLHILNSDNTGHNTDLQSASGRAARVNASIPSGGTVVYEPVYKSKGPFKVNCSIHPWMAAYIHVSDHPFSAVSGEGGSFEIKHVPSGVELEFRLWHESANKLGGVNVNDSEAQYSRGKITRTFVADKEVDWTIEIDVSNFSHLFK